MSEVSKPRLLLADDSPTIQKVVNLTFADEGIDVVTVGDGESAMREIAERIPDIVLADVHMPGPNGYEICGMLRTTEETADIPVVLLVGSFETFDPAEAERVGANGHVTKPFPSIRDLIDRVNSLVGRPLQQAHEDQVPATIQLPPLEEVQKVPAELDTSDIDNLYHQSFAETVEMPMGMSSYATDRLDDEILETSYVNNEQRPAEEESDAGSANGIAAADESHQVPSDEAAVEVRHPLEDTGAAMAAPTEELHRDPFATTADAFNFDELNLLDIDPNATDQSFEITTPSDAVVRGSNTQVVSLSPQLLDIIVQKVVEKLSEKY